jgi:hypothetical protein
MFYCGGGSFLQHQKYTYQGHPKYFCVVWRKELHTVISTKRDIALNMLLVVVYKMKFGYSLHAYMNFIN